MIMTERERNELIAAMRNQTQLGRLNQAEIAAAFDTMAGLGYNIVKMPEPKPEPVVEVAAPEPTPAPVKASRRGGK
jgi:tellurite resistance protein